MICRSEKEHDDIMEYVGLLKDVDNVIEACFGKDLHVNAMETIEILKDSYRAFGWPETPKPNKMFLGT